MGKWIISLEYFLGIYFEWEERVHNINRSEFCDSSDLLQNFK